MSKCLPGLSLSLSLSLSLLELDSLEDMVDYYELASRPSYQDSLKLLEADIHHANFLAASFPRLKRGACLQMKLVYNHFAPILLYLLHWMDFSCTSLLSSYFNPFRVVIYKVCSDGRPDVSTYGRQATIKEFYTVILPSLQRLHGDLSELDSTHGERHSSEKVAKKRLENSLKLSDIDVERESECGICLEPCAKMVLPNCCHSMCINCYHDWNTRSESCPFCRGSLKRVKSGDLWVLTRSSDVVDTRTVLKEDIFRFYLFINSLPEEIPDALFVMYYEHLI